MSARNEPFGRDIWDGNGPLFFDGVDSRAMLLYGVSGCLEVWGDDDE